MEILLEFLVQPIGAFIFWLIKGFKQPYSEEFSKEKAIRNDVAGGITIVVVLVILVLFLFQK